MKLFALITLGSFALGQLGALSIGTNVTLYIQDVVLVCFVIYTAFTNRTLVYGKLTYPIVTFAAIGILSLIVNAYRFSTPNILVSSLYLLRWALYGCLYFIALVPRIRPHQWLTWTYWTGVVVAVLGLVQYFYYPYLRNLSYLGWDPHLYRVFSTFLDPNYLSLYLVLTLFLGASLIEKKTRVIYVLGEVVTGIALLLTYSRSGFVALFVGMVVYAIVERKIKLVAIGVAIFVGVLFVLPKTDGEGVRLLRTASSIARVGNWQRGFSLIQESPVFGFGFNTLRIVQARRGWIDEASGVPSKAGAGLDDSLQFVWATTGILGLASYLWIVYSIGSLCTKLLSNNTTRLLGVMALSGLIATIVHSQFINSLFYPQILAWWWIVSAAIEQSLTVGSVRGGSLSSDSLRHPSRQSPKRYRRR